LLTTLLLLLLLPLLLPSASSLCFAHKLRGSSMRCAKEGAWFACAIAFLRHAGRVEAVREVEAS